MGDRSHQTVEKFWETIKQHKMEKISSDHWKSYQSIVAKEKHLQTKAETFTVEAYNNLFRHFLARMRRKSNAILEK
ncbi:IS1 family transposase [Elizabethkingia argenteiflava]|uniref:IS1 family transposase n=1 Tax=Elizabethkingia argenteiflava TaxID=2681556 RepID=UPI00293BD4E3|nr:IS1 family transposase [Elizabethkingia argenteiflava]